MSAEQAPAGGVAWWDHRFQTGGSWEQSGGRQQTRTFAEAFCRHVRLDRREPFTMLDVGCALGDALDVFTRRYPRAALTGVDVSPVAVERCQEELGTSATCSVSSIEGLEGSFDVIYISNVLEHFSDYPEKARRLAQRCDRLCVMVPYLEHRDGQPLQPDGSEGHQHTFDTAAFDFLVEEGRATAITTHLVVCPGAWGWAWRKRLKNVPKNLVRRLSGRPTRRSPRQVIFDICCRQTEG